MPLSRSQVMTRVRSSGTSPELRVRRTLWRAGLRYRLDQRVLGVRPDLIFPARRLAVFIDGCFWHGCPLHYHAPRSNRTYWDAKLASNIERDRRQTLELERAGWRVLRLWEHEAAEGAMVPDRVRAALDDESWRSAPQWRVVGVRPVPFVGRESEWRALQILRDFSICRDEVIPRASRGRGPVGGGAGRERDQAPGSR